MPPLGLHACIIKHPFMTVIPGAPSLVLGLLPVVPNRGLNVIFVCCEGILGPCQVTGLVDLDFRPCLGSSSSRALNGKSILLPLRSRCPACCFAFLYLRKSAEASLVVHLPASPGGKLSLILRCVGRSFRWIWCVYNKLFTMVNAFLLIIKLTHSKQFN